MTPQLSRRGYRGLKTAKMAYYSGRGLLLLVTWFLSFIFMIPFLWSVSSSLKKPIELYVFPPLILPAQPQWGNYAELFHLVTFERWTFNSLVVSLLCVVGTVASSSLVAFGFARRRFPGRDTLFMLMMSTMMIPGSVTLIPSYLLFYKFHWINTLKPLIVPSYLGGGAVNIFLMRQFIMTIPRDFDDAARVDGAGVFQIYWNVLMPLCKPALTTVAIITFIATWDEFLTPLIYLNSEAKFTLALGLRFFQGMTEMTAKPMDHLLMAASLLMTLPPVLLFFMVQQYFVRGIVMSGIKG